MYQPGQLADAHGVGKYSDEYMAVEAEYARMARAHRMNMSTSIYPEVSGTGAGTTIVWDSWHDEFASRWLDGTIFGDGRGSELYALPIGRDNPDPAEHGGLGSPEFEATFTAMLTQFRDHFQERGWFDRSFLYIVDEPNSQEVLRPGALLRRPHRQDRHRIPLHDNRGAGAAGRELGQPGRLRGHLVLRR